MGHHYTTVRAIGKNREDAEGTAISEFFYEHGHRHSFRDFESAKLLRKVPPKKQVEESMPGLSFGYGRPLYATRVTMVDDPTAPPDQWLEEWEFEIHSHA